MSVEGGSHIPFNRSAAESGRSAYVKDKAKDFIRANLVDEISESLGIVTRKSELPTEVGEYHQGRLDKIYGWYAKIHLAPYEIILVVQDELRKREESNTAPL